MIGIAIAIVLPLVINLTGSYWMHILILIGIYAILATSLNLIMGYTGQADLAHSALYGIGGYTSGLLAVKLGINFWLTVPLAGIAAIIIGAMIGFVTLRLRGTYFALACTAFLFLMLMVFANLRKITGGVLGLPIPIASVGRFVPSQQDKIIWAYIIFAFLLLTIFIIDRIVHSRIGRALIAIREDEDLAKSSGVNTFRFKMIAFVIATFFAGIAGALYATYNGMIMPDDLSIMVLFSIVTACVIGGIGTVLGPIIGAVFVILLPEVLRMTGNYYYLIFGVMIIVVTLFAPSGIMGLITSARKKFGAARSHGAGLGD